MSEVRNDGQDILRVENLEMHFIQKKKHIRAVNNVSFSVRRGETFGFVGESGCGKSATCKAILRLLPENGRIMGGKIFYCGENLLDLSEKQMRKVRGKEIGIIFQEPMTALNPVLKIKEQMYEQFLDTSMTKEEKREKAIKMLRLVGIPSPETRLNEYIHQYSGGMRQRAMIALALAAEPRLLLAAAPTTALDVTIQAQIIRLIESLKESLGMSIILITHDLGVVSEMCDRVAVMYAGTIVEMTDTKTLFACPRHPYTEGLMQSLPKDSTRRGQLRAIQGMPPDLSGPGLGCSFCPRCKYASGECAEMTPQLREIAPNHWVSCHHAEQTEGTAGLIRLNDTEHKEGT